MRSTRFRLHVGMEGKTGKGMGRGERGGEKEVAVCVLGGVGSDAFLLVPFPGNSLDPGARHASRSTTLNLSFKNVRFSYIVSARLQADPFAVCSTNHSSNHQGRRLTFPNNLISSNVRFQARQEAASSYFEGRSSHNRVLVE